MEIDFWETVRGDCPVADYIEALPVKVAKKFTRTLELIEKYGVNFLLHSQIMKKLQGYNLYEIRIIFNNICYRIFCVIKRTVCWLLHIFIKKSNNTPVKEINIALERAKKLDLLLNLS